MSLRRTAQIAAALAFVALGVWVVRGKKWEALRKPVVIVSAEGAPTSKPRSAADIIPQLKDPPKRTGVTIKDLLAGKVPQLNQLEVEAFLKNQGRSSANLLAASRLLNDLSFAREAAKADPKDPAAQLELALRGETPEEKSAAVAAFREAAPGNSLGDFLAAHQAFLAGDAGAAASALAQSLDNPLFADYSQKIVAGSEQAFLEAGYEPTAAAGAAMFALTVPRAQPLMDVSKNLISLQQEFIRSADFDVAEPTVIIGLTLGQRIQDQGPYLIDQLMGVSIERQFLEQLDPLTQAGPGGQSAGERLAALDAKLMEVRSLTTAFTEKFASSGVETRGRDRFRYLGRGPVTDTGEIHFQVSVSCLEVGARLRRVRSPRKH
ncbi:MAG: hypothetical protein EBS64_07685 [Verrucomicrobia bacterium]|nr:hypothetical protein [Verrucomicrobiota bacterium]